MSDSFSSRPRRWGLLLWPEVVLVGLVLLGLGWVWMSEASQRQDQVLRSITIAGGGLLLMLVWGLVWLAFFARLGFVRTIGVVVACGVLLALPFFLFEIRGVSGDVLPILQWRWADPADAAAPPLGSPEAVAAEGGRLSSPDDYPQFLGPTRNAKLAGPILARDWDERPPRERWRIELGPAWSGFAVAGDYAVTQEQRGTQEFVTAYDLETGELRWVHEDPTRHEDAIAGAGPRATPSIQEGRVYALGGTGRLNVLELATGELVWTTDVVEDAGASVPTYGVAASPLVVDDQVVVLAGGSGGKSLVAYDRALGTVSWSGGDDPAAYSSPFVTELAGRRQIVVLNQRNVTGHDATDGSVLWQYPWPATEKAAQPVPLPGDRLFVSSGYGVGGKLLQIAASADGAFSAELVWESLGLKAKFTNVVLREGTLYGLDDGILVALDPETGERRWKRGRYGHGQPILVDDLLVIQAEDGDVALVEAAPDAFRELARIAALDGKTWNTPALAGAALLLRNDREALCLDLPLE